MDLGNDKQRNLIKKEASVYGFRDFFSLDDGETEEEALVDKADSSKAVPGDINGLDKGGKAVEDNEALGEAEESKKEFIQKKMFLRSKGSLTNFPGSKKNPIEFRKVRRNLLVLQSMRRLGWKKEKFLSEKKLSLEFLAPRSPSGRSSDQVSLGIIQSCICESE